MIDQAGWTTIGDRTTHFQGAVTATELVDAGTSVEWVTDFPPDEISAFVEAAMTAGPAAMQTPLDRLA